MKPDPLASCTVCGKAYMRRTSLQSVCSVKCATGVAKASRKARQEADKAQRAALAKRRESLKSRGEWAREAQAAFNAWIRSRDDGKGCISCGTHNGKKNAGHFRSVGAAPELRFNEMNVHLQCERCNTYLSGNLLEYRARLIDRIGLAEVEKLEGPHETRKYTIPELREIKETYRAKLRELQK